jgi:hypothetical protein
MYIQLDFEEIKHITRENIRSKETIMELQGRADVPGPSFRYDVISGDIYYSRQSDGETISNFFFNFIKETGVAKLICDQLAGNQGRSMDEHIEPLKAQVTLKKFIDYLRNRMELKLSIRFIIKALAFHGIVISEQTESVTRVAHGNRNCMQVFHIREASSDTPCDLVNHLARERMMDVLSVIDFQTVIDLRRPRISEIGYEDISKMRYVALPNTFVREFDFSCSARTIESGSCTHLTSNSSACAHFFSAHHRQKNESGSLNAY